MKKKILSALVALVLSGFVAAEEKEPNGNGFTAGVGISLGNVSKELAISVTPQLIYDNFFGPAGLYFEIDYTLLFLNVFYTREDNVHLIQDFPQSLYLEAEGLYRLSLGTASMLTFRLNNKISTLTYPRPEDMGNRLSILIDPNITFTQDIEDNEVYGTAGLPFGSLGGIKYDHLGLYTYLTLGFKSFYDFGIEITGNIDLHSERISRGVSWLIFYEKADRYYAELEFRVDKKFKVFSLLPAAEVNLKNNLTIRGEVEFDNLGGTGDAYFIPTVWVKYRF